MKNKYHLTKNKVFVQLTDGSIFKIKLFSKISILKLNSDPKSHILWKNVATEPVNINFTNSFIKKFLYKKQSQ